MARQTAEAGELARACHRLSATVSDDWVLRDAFLRLEKVWT